MITQAFTSKSSDTVHTAHYDPATGASDCSCAGWRFVRAGQPRGCKHTKELEAKYAPAFDLSAPTAPLPVTLAPEPVVTNAVEPMLASAMTHASLADYCSDAWVMEPKIDGHRLLVSVTGKTVFCYSRGGKPRTVPPAMLAELATLPEGLYDGELHIPGGMSSDVTRTDRVADLRLALFDVLRAFGCDVMSSPGTKRRDILLAAVGTGRSLVYVVPQLPVSKAGVEALWAQGEEGAVIKRTTAVYVPGRRSAEWIKVKKAGAAVCTIVGFEAGLCGPYSCVTLTEDGVDRPAFPVKSQNNLVIAEFAANPDAFLGRKLVVSFTERFPATQVMRHPMFDHWASDDEAAGHVAAPWAYIAKKSA